jgi:cytochrome o ubiquinol oxidase subunit 1
MMTFVLGGFTGIILAMPPLDYLVHNTLFLVAHFHNMLIPGLLYGMLAGYHYWFPKAFGFRLDERWGRIAFTCWVVGFYLAFFPLYVLGASGMARRTQAIFEPSFRPWLYVACIGAFILLAALLSLGVQLWVSIRDRASTRVEAGDPWDGRGLEWSISAPPPEYNFAVLPDVDGRNPFYDHKHDEGQPDPYASPPGYEDITVPRGSMTGVAIGLAAAVAAFGLVWEIWGLAVIAAEVIVAAVVLRSFGRDQHRVVPAAEVARDHEAWLARVRTTPTVRRELETTLANRGRAEIEV